MKTIFRDKKTGRFRACRVTAFHNRPEDPMDAYAGADIMGDVCNDLRKRDLRDGCPTCRAEVIENASEPDVMQRWGLR